MITRWGTLLSSVGAAVAAGPNGLPTAALAQDRATAGIVFQQDQYVRMILIGRKAAADASGVELLEANSDTKLEKETQLIDTDIAQPFKPSR